MAKSILFLLAAVSLASAGLVIEDEKVLPWQSKAFEWLCTEVSKGKTNQEVAEYISTQLSIYYAPGVFTVYVGTVNSTLGHYVDPAVASDDEDNPSDPNDDIASNSLCDRDLYVVRVQNGKELCLEGKYLNESLLTQLLDFSVGFADVNDGDSLIKSALATEALGFHVFVSVATSDSANAGLAASTPSKCDMKYENAPWVLGFFGTYDYESIKEKPITIAATAVLNTLQANAAATNQELATSVKNALLDESNLEEFWVPFVSDVATPENLAVSSENMTDWYNNTAVLNNLVGKNLVLGYGNSSLGCDEPLSEGVMKTIVDQAVANGNYSTVVDDIVDGAKLIGYDRKFLIVAEDGNAGVSSYINFDCVYEYPQDSGWTIFLYAVPVDQEALEEDIDDISI